MQSIADKQKVFSIIELSEAPILANAGWDQDFLFRTVYSVLILL